MATDHTEKERMFALDQDIAELEKMLIENPAIKLVVIDPASSYLGNARMEKEQEIRRALGPLAQLAERTGVTFLLVMHNNKRADVSALHRIMGAVAISGVARIVWLCAQDPEDEDNYLFLCSKANIGRMPKGLQYGIEGKELPGVGNIGTIVWKGTTDVTADQALILKSGAESGKLTAAKQWLTTYLDTHKPYNEVIEAAKQEGISEKTLRRAKKELKIISDQTSDGWFWLAPGGVISGSALNPADLRRLVSPDGQPAP
jgi:AAA domain